MAEDAKVKKFYQKNFAPGQFAVKKDDKVPHSSEIGKKAKLIKSAVGKKAKNNCRLPIVDCRLPTTELS